MVGCLALCVCAYAFEFTNSGVFFTHGSSFEAKPVAVPLIPLVWGVPFGNSLEGGEQTKVCFLPFEKLQIILPTCNSHRHAHTHTPTHSHTMHESESCICSHQKDTSDSMRACVCALPALVSVCIRNRKLRHKPQSRMAYYYYRDAEYCILVLRCCCSFVDVTPFQEFKRV